MTSTTAPEIGRLRLSQRPKHDAALDGIRGLAALCVLGAHLTHPSPVVDPLWAPPEWVQHCFPATAAVLLFFVLSGYVIGISTPEYASWPAVQRYVLRRMVRLWPIALFAIAAAVIAGGFPGWRAMIGNVAFLQNDLDYGRLHIPVLVANPNLWSLNYEAVYYIAFIAVWILRPNLALVFGIAAVAGTIGWLLPSFWWFAAAFCCGALFWYAGLALAWSAQPVATRTGNWILAAVVTWLTWRGEFLQHDLSRIEWDLPKGIWVTPGQLDLIVPAVWLIGSVARRHHALLNLCAWEATLWVTAHLVWRTFRADPGDRPEFLISLAVLLSVAASWKWRPSLAWLERCAPAGTIAYAVYAIGWPIQYEIRQLAPAIAGTPVSYLFRAVTVVLLTVAIAWWLERWLQPRLTETIIRRPTPPEGVPIIAA